MSEQKKNSIIRGYKLLHCILTIVLFAVAFNLFYGYKYDIVDHTKRYWIVVAIYTVMYLFSRRTYNAYDVDLSRVGMLIYSQTISQIITCGIVYAILFIDFTGLVYPIPILNPLPLIGLLVVQFAFNCAWSFSAKWLYSKMFSAKRTVIIYRNEADYRGLQEVYRYEKDFKVEKVVKGPTDVYELLEEIKGYEAVFVAGINATMRNGVSKYCIEHNVPCYIAPHVGDIIMMGAKHIEHFSVPIFRMERSAPKIEYEIVKRGVDIVCSLLGIIVTSPFMLITALAIKLYDKGPALYKQVRLTKDGREFKILKFRSMRTNAESDGVARLATDNDDRITPVGKIIRACRLHQLTQLINILKGDMSFVGPRPERPEIAKQYEEKLHSFPLRLQVRAGLTGLAQVYGKYNTDPYDKLQMDLMYVNNMSPFEDLKLIFATIKILFMRESTSGVEEGQMTAISEREMEETMEQLSLF